MTQYAYFDSTQPTPAQVVGWYDTEFFEYPNLPAAADLLEVTPEQWESHFENPSAWAVSNNALVAYVMPAQAPTAAAAQAQAQAALTESDKTILRCYENNVAVPAAWATYRAALRAIVSAPTAGETIPTRPAYPANT